MRGISMMDFIRIFCQVLFLSILVSSVNGQTSRYSRVRPNYQYTSPYNTDIIQGAMMYKQQQVDRNMNLIYDKIDEINETLDNVYANIGGFSEEQLKAISKYTNDINNRCKGDMSNNGYVRGIISVMNSWNRYFKSWERKETIQYNNYSKSSENKTKLKYNPNNSWEKTTSPKYYDSAEFPKIITLDTPAQIWNFPSTSMGKTIENVKGTVKVLEKTIGTSFYKIEWNNQTAYIHASYVE